MKFSRFLVAALGALGIVAAGYAVGQVSLAKVTSVGTADLFNDVVNGVPVAGNRYATAAQIDGVPGYYALYSGADAAGQTLTYTATAGVSNIVSYSSGAAITSVTITTEASPGDGQRECYVGAGGATSSLTFTPNTGQTLVSTTITAGVSNVPICITYVAPLKAWYRSS